MSDAPSRLDILDEELRDWLDGGAVTPCGLSRSSGNPFATEARVLQVGTRLEDLARLSLTTEPDGAAGVGIWADGFSPALPGSTHLNVQAVLEYLNSSITAGTSERPWVDDLTVPATIYCSTTGSDSTGDGTIGSPYRQPERAVRDIPIWSRLSRVISCGAGTFDLPQMAFAWNRVFLTGTKSIAGSRSITSINASTVATGLVLTLDGAAFAGVDSETGTLLIGTSGVLIGDDCWIYANDAGTTISLSQSTSASSAFGIPIVGDDLDFYSLDTTFDIPSVCSFLACGGGCQIIDAKITGANLNAFATDQISLVRVLLENRRLNVGGFGRVLSTRSYHKHTGQNSTVGMISVLNQAQWFVNRGTIIDGAAATATRDHLKTSNQSSIETDGELIFQHFNDKGIALHGTQLATRRVSGGTGHNEWRLIDFDEDGIVANDGEGLGTWCDLPDLYGSVGRFAVRGHNNFHAILGSGSAIATGFGPGTNEVSTDNGATKSAGVELDGSRIQGADPAVTFTARTPLPCVTRTIANDLTIVAGDTCLTRNGRTAAGVRLTIESTGELYTL